MSKGEEEGLEHPSGIAGRDFRGSSRRVVSSVLSVNPWEAAGHGG